MTDIQNGDNGKTNGALKSRSYKKNENDQRRMLGDYKNFPEKSLEIGVSSKGGGKRLIRSSGAQEQRCTAMTVKGFPDTILR